MSLADYIIACAALDPKDDKTKREIAKITMPIEGTPHALRHKEVWCPQCRSYECVPGCSY